MTKKQVKTSDFFDSHIIMDMPDNWGKDKQDKFKQSFKKKLVEKCSNFDPKQNHQQ